MQASPKIDPLLGSVLLGTYQIDRLLGRGGMGAVYAATHVHLLAPCAIKVLRREYSEEGEPLKRFQREAQITSQLGHPNIVRVTDFNFTPDGEPFMVMELLRGETLHRRLRGRGQLSLPEVVRLFGPLCDALGLAHDKGVIHRDLKPENIFLPEDLGLDGAKILDFGISKIRDGNTRLTKADMTMGTQSYMAPEIVCGAAAEADVRSDVFSLGAILYEVLTARMAYDGPNAMAVMYKLMYGDPPSVRAFDPAIPEAVDQVVRRALSRSPAERIATAPDLFKELLAAAMPYLPAAEDLEAQISTPYRYTSGALRAVRLTGALPAVGTGPHAEAAGSALSPPPPSGASQGRQTGPQGQPGPAEDAGPRLTPPGAAPVEEGETFGAPLEPSDAIEEDLREVRPRPRRGGALVTATIAALVLLTGAGLWVLRQRMTTRPAPPAVVAPAAAPAPPATVPPAPVPAPAPAPAPAALEDEERREEKPGKRKRRSRRGGTPRELPRLQLPAAD